ncbi:MAG TPA: polyribonucleotide nucleotidyltransferase [Bacteroidales bacterium]|nr:polyribonucleotide nucleotidyltransferase [Bacteroidales bacterium]HQN14843.1 polyribonucleotide nucleotidyltransferase [Bacteroidales bacterium]HQP14375.1 polyribonucleotide nucleotidyltransferase [Bacteroidales bacterium]
MMNGINKSFDIGDGRMINLETGKLAKQADGSVVVKMGDTMLLATVVSKKEAGENVDFMPLSVDYQEKYAATGRFPGGFFKREARPSEYEILVSRLIDRALRPLFPDDYHAETQVLVTLISGDKECMPDALACLAASTALTISDIPFNGPISEVRVGRIDGKFVVNPSTSDILLSDFDIMVAASMDNIVMVEGEMKEVSENDLLEALKFAHETIRIQCRAQLELAAMIEKSKAKREYCHETNDETLRENLRNFAYQKTYDVASQATLKHERTEAFEKIKADFILTIPEEERAAKEAMINRYYFQVEKEAVRNMMLNDRKRLDGRKLDQIRPIWCEVDYLPAAHGSSIFTRGETQSLTTVTLGTKLDEQIIDGVIFDGKNKFMLHYNFPPFSTGEVKMMRGTGRREIGHGNLAHRALKNMIPWGEENPYTIRIVSDILESNGSSSMATVCAGTLALMDAGVKLKKPVSGIAMGLISGSEGKYAILSDILGDEDHLGDMDFKVTGTRDGITACQMDIKVDGLSYEILSEALSQARAGRFHILGEMEKTISVPRADYKPHVPRIVQMTIPKEFIGAVIGPGGKIIQEIQNSTGATIVIEEEGELGIVDIVSSDKESTDKAINWIRKIVAVPEVGEVYTGKVRNLQPFGAFIEILPGKDGLLHISEIDWKRTEDVEKVFKIGDEVQVKLIEIDKKTGKLKLSRKALLPKPPQQQ